MPLRVLMVLPASLANQPLERFFRERGDNLLHVARIEEAFGELEQFKPDLLVLDLHFAGNEWLNFLRYTRQKYPDLKIILTNKYPDLQRELMAAEHGVQVFLRQPFTNRWIENTVSRAFAKPTNGRATTESIKQLPRVRMPVRFKITLPYLVLALLFALASAYIISQIVLESIQDRYLNQLISTGRQAADWMVGEENRLLSTLRLVANSQGIAELVKIGDSEGLRTLAFPLAVNAREEDVEVLDLQGVALLSLRLKPGGNAADYESGRGDALFQQQDFVRRILLSQSDQAGDKYAGLVMAPWGKYFFVAGPVYDASGALAGVALVGKSLDTLAKQMSQDTLAQVSFYDQNGGPLASALFEGEASGVDLGMVQQVLASQDQISQTRNLAVTGLNYTEILGPWEVRSGQDLGLLGTALSQSFLVRTSNVTQLEVFGLVAAAVILVIGLGLALAGRITRPLVRLAAASTEVAQGNLEVRVDSQGNDEIAVLAHAFNYMVAGLQEGSVYRDLLGRTVSPEVREQLRQTFTSGNLRLEGQQAVATVLMSDIRGFTSISERSDPAAVLNWLNEYFGRLVPIITAHGGVVNKFDGDAMLAFFGILPMRLNPKEGAHAACEAALEMLKAVDELNAQRLSRSEPPLVTGIGLNTGVVIAGGLGSNDRLHYTIIGDTVNSTQRIEALTRQVYPTNGILIGQSTHLALGESVRDFRLDPAGTFSLRGKSDQIQVYRLLPQQVRVAEVML